MKQRYIRPRDELSDDTVVVVRGGELHRELLAEDAMRAHSVYGVYAISVFAADGVTVDELVQTSPLIRFEMLTLMTVGSIRSADLLLVPSGRNPLHHSIDLTNLDDALDRLIGCDHRTVVNPYHEA